jgi:hypothetical protein
MAKSHALLSRSVTVSLPNCPVHAENREQEIKNRESVRGKRIIYFSSASLPPASCYVF